MSAPLTVRGLLATVRMLADAYWIVRSRAWRRAAREAVEAERRYRDGEPVELVVIPLAVFRRDVERYLADRGERAS